MSCRSSTHLDDRRGHRPAARGPGADRVRDRAAEHAQARDLRRVAAAGGAAAAPGGGAGRRPRRASRARPRFSTLITVASPFAHGRRPARRARRRGRLRRAGRDLRRPDDRRHLADHAGRHHHPGDGRVPRRTVLPADAGARRPAASWAPRPRCSTCAAQTLSYAAPETALMGAACTEVAHYLDLPVIAAGVATRRQAPRRAGRLREGAQGAHTCRRRGGHPERRRRHPRGRRPAQPAPGGDRRRDRRLDALHPRRR